MRYIIQKLKYCCAVVLLASGFALLLSGPASAATPPPADQTGDVGCVQGGTTFTIKPNNTSHTTTVTCKDGSQIIYNPSATQQNLVSLQVDCKGSSVPGIQVKAPNQPNAKIVFYCVESKTNGDSPTTRATVTPTVKVSAANNAKCPDGVTPLPADGDISKCPSTNGGNCASVNNCDLIQKYINPFINFLAALVGVAVVISIIIGGIQYGSSAGDPAKVSAAKNRVRNAIIALLTFLFLYALLNFLIPGGLL